MTSHKFHSRSKIWIEDDHGNVVFGLGRYRILTLIKEKGSLQAAAKQLKMGYRGIWGRIKATEERLGEKLLIKTVGGRKGGGSQLVKNYVPQKNHGTDIFCPVIKNNPIKS